MMHTSIQQSGSVSGGPATQRRGHELNVCDASGLPVSNSLGLPTTDLLAHGPGVGEGGGAGQALGRLEHPLDLLVVPSRRHACPPIHHTRHVCVSRILGRGRATGSSMNLCRLFLLLTCSSEEAAACAARAGVDHACQVLMHPHTTRAAHNGGGLRATTTTTDGGAACLSWLPACCC